MLPYKAAKIITDLIPDSNDEIILELGERILTVESNGIEINCRLTDGRYPNYRSVLPGNYINKSTISKDSFIAALHRVSLFSNQQSKLVKLNFNDNKIKIEANDYDFSNSASETIGCDYTGKTVEIGFKSSFLIQSIEAISTDYIVFTMSDSTKPALLFPDDDEKLTVLLMPMLINT